MPFKGSSFEMGGVEPNIDRSSKLQGPTHTNNALYIIAHNEWESHSGGFCDEIMARCRFPDQSHNMEVAKDTIISYVGKTVLHFVSRLVLEG